MTPIYTHPFSQNARLFLHTYRRAPDTYSNVMWDFISGIICREEYGRHSSIQTTPLFQQTNAMLQHLRRWALCLLVMSLMGTALNLLLIRGKRVSYADARTTGKRTVKPGFKGDSRRKNVLKEDVSNTALTGIIRTRTERQFEGETKYNHQFPKDISDKQQFADESSDSYQFLRESTNDQSDFDKNEFSQWIQHIFKNNRPTAADVGGYNRNREIDTLQEKGSMFARGKCEKSIHFYADENKWQDVPELRKLTSELVKTNWTLPCTSFGYNCDMRVSLGGEQQMLSGKDAVVVGMVMTSIPWRRTQVLKNLQTFDPEPEQTWIYYSTEPPYRVVHWSMNTDVAQLKYHVLMTYNPQADVHIPFGYYRPFSEADHQESRGFAMDMNPASLKATEVLQRNRTGLISWVASNCDQVFWPRNQLVARLRELIPLDDYGNCGHKTCLPRRSVECNQLFASYKFYLAAPNSECNDYISEKFWDISLNNGVVPVVVGARKSDYEKVAPPHSFIHGGDFESLDEFADYLRKVDMDDELYASYHAWRMKGEIILTYPLPGTEFCRILPHMRTRTPNETKLVGDSPWYRGCREIPGLNHLVRPPITRLNNWTIWK